jgi:hypothetical protein
MEWQVQHWATAAAIVVFIGFILWLMCRPLRQTIRILGQSATVLWQNNWIFWVFLVVFAVSAGLTLAGMTLYSYRWGEVVPGSLEEFRATYPEVELRSFRLWPLLLRAFWEAIRMFGALYTQLWLWDDHVTLSLTILLLVLWRRIHQWALDTWGRSERTELLWWATSASAAYAVGLAIYGFVWIYRTSPLETAQFGWTLLAIQLPQGWFILSALAFVLAGGYKITGRVWAGEKATWRDLLTPDPNTWKPMLGLIFFVWLLAQLRFVSAALGWDIQFLRPYWFWPLVRDVVDKLALLVIVGLWPMPFLIAVERCGFRSALRKTIDLWREHFVTLCAWTGLLVLLLTMGALAHTTILRLTADRWELSLFPQFAVLALFATPLKAAVAAVGLLAGVCLLNALTDDNRGGL